MDFDVPEWLASLTGCGRDEIALLNESERGGHLSVTYAREGTQIATVDLVALPLAGRASWQLLAQVDGRVERVQMPARTRFVWR